MVGIESCSMPDNMENTYTTSVVKPEGNCRPFERLRCRVEANLGNILCRNGAAKWEWFCAVQGMSHSQRCGVRILGKAETAGF